MSTRPARGFTLLELLVGLTLTALAAAMAGGALSAARSTADVVERHRAGAEAELRWRVMAADLLRHAPPAAAHDDARLAVSGATDAPALEFLSRGLAPSMGTGRTWRVRVWQHDDTLHLRATPAAAAPDADATADAALDAYVTPARALRIDVLEPVRVGEVARWRTDWPLRQARPRAVRLQWEGARGATTLLVPLDPLGGEGA